jgi:hypothetical protein
MKMDLEKAMDIWEANARISADFCGVNGVKVSASAWREDEPASDALVMLAWWQFDQAIVPFSCYQVLLEIESARELASTLRRATKVLYADGRLHESVFLHELSNEEISVLVGESISLYYGGFDPGARNTVHEHFVTLSNEAEAEVLARMLETAAVAADKPAASSTRQTAPSFVVTDPEG